MKVMKTSTAPEIVLPDALRAHLQSGARYGAAVSGGLDSTALLHALTALRPQVPFELIALHFNHGLRGAESDADEQFCRDICAQWQVPFDCDSADVRALAQARGCLLYTSPSPRDGLLSRMPSSA